jgi:hypothetical protein
MTVSREPWQRLQSGEISPDEYAHQIRCEIHDLIEARRQDVAFVERLRARHKLLCPDCGMALPVGNDPFAAGAMQCGGCGEMVRYTSLEVRARRLEAEQASTTPEMDLLP